MEKDNSQEKDKKEENFDEILAKESPELFLEVKMKGREGKPSERLYNYASGPARLMIAVIVIDIIAALILTIITKISHFDIWGSLGVVVAIPWWLAFLDGFVFIGYGIYVIKTKKGELDIGPMTTMRKTVEVRGEVAPLLGLIYILLGIFLIVAVIIRCYIQGIFK
jgi:hypothetical protein